MHGNSSSSSFPVAQKGGTSSSLVHHFARTVLPNFDKVGILFFRPLLNAELAQMIVHCFLSTGVFSWTLDNDSCCQQRMGDPRCDTLTLLHISCLEKLQKHCLMFNSTDLKSAQLLFADFGSWTAVLPESLC
jgi:hypothetical protein